MKVSSMHKVREMYESTAESYDKMMDTEINLSIYSNILERLKERITNIPGALIDTACGSGHMLFKYFEQFDQSHDLLGIDLSSRMVEISKNKLGNRGKAEVGDMRDLSNIAAKTAAAVINFFAIHHLDSVGVRAAINEWHRVLRTGGQLILAAWEGAGAIDYGDEYDIVAFRYGSEELSNWTQGSGFSILRCWVESVEGFPMDAIYLEGIKE